MTIATTKVTVLAQRLEEAQTALNKLIRKAKRYGNTSIMVFTGPVYVVKETYKRWDGTSAKRKVSYVDLEISGEAPRVGAYEFLASIELTEAGNIVDTVPGVEGLYESFRHSAGTCDHCKVTRGRKHVFVVRNVDTGEQLQVGRSCLRDFLGMDNPTAIAQSFAFWSKVASFFDEDDSYLTNPFLTFCEPTESVIALTFACVRMFGWASKGQAQADPFLTPTAEYVEMALGERPRPVTVRGVLDDSAGKLWDRIHSESTQEDWDKARKVMAWVVDGLNPRSDYEHNLSVVCAEENVTSFKRIGLLCSVVPTWNRAMERETRRTREQQEAQKSTFQGEVKERLRGLKVTLVSQRNVGENAWGIVVLVKFADEAGNLYSWFTSSGTGRNDGEQFTIDGTVKNHNEFRGIQETVLTRVKIKEEEAV